MINESYLGILLEQNEQLEHHGILGMKWGVRKERKLSRGERAVANEKSSNSSKKLSRGERAVANEKSSKSSKRKRTTARSLVKRNLKAKLKMAKLSVTNPILSTKERLKSTTRREQFNNQVKKRVSASKGLPYKMAKEGPEGRRGIGKLIVRDIASRGVLLKNSYRHPIATKIESFQKTKVREEFNSNIEKAIYNKMQEKVKAGD